MGSGSSKPSTSNEDTAASAAASSLPTKTDAARTSGTGDTCPVTHSNAPPPTSHDASKPSSSSGCPMKKWGRGGASYTSSSPPSSGCPVKHKHRPANTATPSQEASSACPVKQQQQQQQQYNVYAQPIDPKNQMPAVANQLPAPGQKVALPTERVKSTIPKGGTNDGTTWTYPSPQMFYNALARKQKLGNTTESDIESVVALHNNMNERTWNKVLEWERVVAGSNSSSDDNDNVEYEQPKLLKFMGRPSDLSPKAAFKHYILGHPLPFDRHDWTVLRNDGTQVRYVIDYYHDDSRAQEEEATGFPGLHDFDATPSLLVDVRPALDSPRSLLDRAVHMPYARHFAHSTTFTPMPIMPTSELKSQVTESVEVWDSIQKAKQQQRRRSDNTTENMNGGGDKTNLSPPPSPSNLSETEAVELAKSFGRVLKDCRDAQEKVNACTTEQECARASMDLTMCMAKLWCPLQHKAVVDALHHRSTSTATISDEEYDARVEKALENMSACVANASQNAQQAKQEYPQVFQDVVG